MAATALVVLHPPAPLALAGFVTLSALMVASFPFPRIDAATAPLMGVWWAFAAVTATRVIPPWPVAAFTLVAISGLLLLVPLRRYAPVKTVSIAASARSIVSTRE
jgi:hypothetical protein